MAFETIEDFFLNSIDISRLFEFMERSEYLLLYNIQRCIDETDGERAYMSDLAERMNLSIIDTSRAVKSLEDKGYLMWRTDENKEHTYVKLTGKAKEALSLQNERMEKAYDSILSEIPDDEMKQTVSTLGKIREIIQNTK